MSYTDKTGKLWLDEPLQDGDTVEYCKPDPVGTEFYTAANGYPLIVARKEPDGSFFLNIKTGGGEKADPTVRHWNILTRNGKPHAPNLALAGVHSAVVGPNGAIAALAPTGGCVCKRCNMLNQYAAPNQKDGTYLCYGCRV